MFAIAAITHQRWDGKGTKIKKKKRKRMISEDVTPATPDAGNGAMLEWMLRNYNQSNASQTID